MNTETVLTERLTTRLHGVVEGSPPAVLKGVAALADATAEQVSFFANTRYRDDLARTHAGLILIAPGSLRPDGKNYLLVDDPYSAWCDVLEMFYPQPLPPPGVHASASVDPSAKLGKDVSVGANATVEAGATVGDGTRIDAGVVIEHGASVGERCHLRAGAIVGHSCKLGARVVLQPGVVIGGDGFGFAMTHGGMRKIPQVGIVEIGDDVEIGANTTIDRATFGVTRIGNGVKIDNLVMIAHNVRVGDYSAIVAQAGIAGSTKLGMGVQIGGQAGIAGHLHIGDGTQIGAQAGIMRDIESGSRIIGSPAVEVKTFFRLFALSKRLPDFWRRLRRIEDRLGISAATDNDGDDE